LKISFWTIGKNHEPYIREGVEDFTARLKRYYPVSWNIMAPPKNAGLMSEADLRKAEAAMVLNLLEKDDFLVVLDEKGKMLSSVQLANFLQLRANESVRNIIFLIGGAYGIDEQVFKRSQLKWSLSDLTFPHQLVRLILAEQVYRACTILRNEKYHHR
jgi:23S rRNA (pseudouridine1915-N3)-methyltransferase